MSVIIRKATFEDLKPCLELWDAMMAEHQRQDARIRLTEGALGAYRSYLSYHLVHSDSCVRVAEADGGEVVGFCLATINRNLPMFQPERYGYLSDLTVASGWRRQGIGRMLLEEISRWLGQRGVDSIQLQYYNFNAGGASFWRAMNFKPFYTRMWLDLA